MAAVSGASAGPEAYLTGPLTGGLLFSPATWPPDTAAPDPLQCHVADAQAIGLAHPLQTSAQLVNGERCESRKAKRNGIERSRPGLARLAADKADNGGKKFSCPSVAENTSLA